MHPLLRTLEQLVEEQTPNFFRLYLNPYVVQTCLCLDRMVRNTWYARSPEKPEFQTFLANSFDEALNGAVKLARFCTRQQGRTTTGLLLGGKRRFDHFVGLSIPNVGRVGLIPGLVVADDGEAAGSENQFGHVVLFPPANAAEGAQLAPIVERLMGQKPLVIACVGRSEIDECRRDPNLWWNNLSPDIVVFDESFVHRHLPFGAFTARRSLYNYWNRPGYANFHSTTFQPNSVSTLHFLRCLSEDDPAFVQSLSEELRTIMEDSAACKRLFASLYNPALCKMIGSLGFDVRDVKAAGHYVTVSRRRIFDGVAGIACSIRGHNPTEYVKEIAALPSETNYHTTIRDRLKTLIGLDDWLPAVSGASAVENALRLGLAARHPKKYVLALQGGFGGKTLFALTGTAKPFYKEGLGALYGSVIYVDPFGSNAIQELESALEQHPVGVVQLELIQAVGGVRQVPEHVIRFLDEGRRRWGYALFVDEVQTGMYRTGPFTMCKQYGIVPDLLTLGKGVSDMMLPFSLTLYSSAIAKQIAERAPELVETLRTRADYEFCCRTLLNTLDRVPEDVMSRRVTEAGEWFRSSLSEALASCPAVREVRVFGMLIAIELNNTRKVHKLLKKQAPFLYILKMLLHPSFPLLIGFCQYEPHVLKLTPPLSITRDEVAKVCATIAEALKTPSYALLPPALKLLAGGYVKERWKRLTRRKTAYESAAS